MRRVSREHQAVFTEDLLKPILTVTINDESGNPVNITGMTLAFAMWPDGAAADATPKVNYAAMAIVTAASGICSYSWAGTDTDTPGTYKCLVRIGSGASSYETTDIFFIKIAPANQDPDKEIGG